MQEPAELAKEYIECFNTRDFERCRRLLHPDFTYRGGDGVEQKGPEVIVELMRTYAVAFPDGRIDIERMWPVDDDTVLVEFVGRGTHDGELMGIAPTGNKVEIVVCDVLQTRDGKIWSEHEYMDQLSMLGQLGVAPGIDAA